MAQIHSSFCRHISTAIEDYEIPYHEFRKVRRYRDFKVELDGLDDEIEIAATALSMLCDGAEGDMDIAVVHAVVDYLEYQLGASPVGFDETAKAIWRRLPIETEEAKRLLRRWYAA